MHRFAPRTYAEHRAWFTERDSRTLGGAGESPSRHSRSDVFMPLFGGSPLPTFSFMAATTLLGQGHAHDKEGYEDHHLLNAVTPSVRKLRSAFLLDRSSPRDG